MQVKQNGASGAENLSAHTNNGHAEAESIVIQWLPRQPDEAKFCQLVANAGGYKATRATGISPRNFKDPIAARIVETVFSLLDNGTDPTPETIATDARRRANECDRHTDLKQWQRVAVIAENELTQLPAKFPNNGNVGDEAAKLAAKIVRASLVKIETSSRQLREVSAEALGTLEKGNVPPRIFMRAAVPVRLGRDEHDRPVIERIGESELRHELTRAADYQRTHAKGISECAPPLDIVRDILATPALPFPPLVGVVQTPTIRPDGSILDVPGYDAATRLLFAPQPGAAIPQVPNAPTVAQAKAARELILDVFADFPFAEQSSRAGAIALALTPIVRPAIAGPVPLAIADATQAGTGKGLLTNVVAIISTGHPAAVEHAPANDEEWDKRITATLREAPAIIALDDVETLKSPSLARALTASEWKGRVLGRSENVTLPQRAAWIATGNNIRLGGDIPRRCYWIRLDAQTSRPWERDGFRHPDLLRWARDHRTQLVAALLTLARAWFAAGCPAPTAKPIGSFEDWTRIIGGILQHAEIPGFLENLPALYDSADDEGPEWEAFLDTLQHEFGGIEITVAQIHERCRGSQGEALREVLPGALLDQLENAGRFRRILGSAFAKRAGRRYGAENLHICRAADDSHAKVARWKVNASNNSNNS